MYINRDDLVSSMHVLSRSWSLGHHSYQHLAGLSCLPTYALSSRTYESRLLLQPVPADCWPCCEFLFQQTTAKFNIHFVTRLHEKEWRTMRWPIPSFSSLKQPTFIRATPAIADTKKKNSSNSLQLIPTYNRVLFIRDSVEMEDWRREFGSLSKIEGLVEGLLECMSFTY